MIRAGQHLARPVHLAAADFHFVEGVARAFVQQHVIGIEQIFALHFLDLMALPYLVEQGLRRAGLIRHVVFRFARLIFDQMQANIKMNIKMEM